MSLPPKKVTLGKNSTPSMRSRVENGGLLYRRSWSSILYDFIARLFCRRRSFLFSLLLNSNLKKCEVEIKFYSCLSPAILRALICSFIVCVCFVRVCFVLFITSNLPAVFIFYLLVIVITSYLANLYLYISFICHNSNREIIIIKVRDIENY